MDNFFAQLRQPLRQNNNQAAIEIALTLTGNHIPDGLVFPDDSRDFLTLALDEVRIGSCYQVLPSAAASDLWVSEMDATVHMVGRAKSVHAGEELVLLQFYDAQYALLFEWWYPVEVSTDSSGSGFTRWWSGRLCTHASLVWLFICVSASNW